MASFRNTAQTFQKNRPLLRQIFKTWWPLAASWLLMGVELPAINAVMARLANPEINLAAYSGVVYPIALIVEAPIIMLLSASVALSKDWASYVKIRKFMWIAGITLTLLHILVAFTPLYDLVMINILGVPQEIIEPGRIGLMIMTPWTGAIAYRRFQQGVMIRFGHSTVVGAGTMVRLSADGLVLLAGLLLGNIPGVVIGALAQALGVVSEALFVGWRVQPILRNELKFAPPVAPLTWKAFFDFYIPLALTSLLTLVWNPIGSAAISRMPHALDSLAVWSVVTGLNFMFRGGGIALNEVVVALLDQKGTSQGLRYFVTGISVSLTLFYLIFAVTPLANFWFGTVSGLPADLAAMAKIGFWIGLPLPLLNVLQSWYQGAVLVSKKTRGIPESVALFLIMVTLVLGAGVVWGKVPGLYVGMVAFGLANLAQTIWLWVRSREIMKDITQRDALALETPQTAN